MDLALLRAELTRDEGLRLRPYTDTTGHLTIGVGRNLTDNGISEREAQVLLLNDIARVVEQLDHALPWWQGLDPVRQRVMANMAFNLGIASFLGFHNTIILIQSGRYDAAAAGMRSSLWARQVGPRAERLAAMMETGKEPTP